LNIFNIQDLALMIFQDLALMTLMRNNSQSATVIDPTAAVSDAWSTALFILGKDSMS